MRHVNVLLIVADVLFFLGLAAFFAIGFDVFIFQNLDAVPFHTAISMCLCIASVVVCFIRTVILR